MCDLREAAENIAAMEAAYKAAGIPQAPETPAPDKPSERVENVAIALGVLTLLALLGQVVVYAMA